MKRNTRVLSITLTSLSIISVSMPGTASAEAMSVGIYPTVTKLVGVPGETVQAQIYVKNNQTETVTLTPLFQPFSASSQEDGTVHYEQSATGFYRTLKLQDAGSTITELTLAPQEEKSLNLLVPIQPQAKSEDYYFSLILLSNPSPADTTGKDETATATTTLSGGVASHILLSISSEKKQNITFAEFSAPSFSQNSPVPFVTRVTNQNNHFSQVDGKITIKNLFGKSVEEVIIPETVILSHSTRALQTQAQGLGNKSVSSDQLSNGLDQKISRPKILQEKKLLPGIYKAEIKLAGSDKLNPISNSLFFAVAPVQLIVGGLLVLILLYLLKRRILAKLR